MDKKERGSPNPASSSAPGHASNPMTSPESLEEVVGGSEAVVGTKVMIPQVEEEGLMDRLR